MKGKRTGHVGFVGTKLDMNKAYDKIEWDYITSTMSALGFSDKWVTLISNCITSITLSLMINNRRCGVVTPHRGIRQGDPFFLQCLHLVCRGLG